MKKIIISLAVVIGLSSCAQEASTENENQEVVQQKSYKVKVVNDNGEEKEITWNGEGEMPEEMAAFMNANKEMTDVQYATTASIGIEGMSCAKMCAGLIEKTLSETEGVKSCEVNFDDKVAMVEYDDAQIGEQKMIEIIEGLHDGQYKVNRVEVRKEAEKEVEKEMVEEVITEEQG